MSTPAPALDLNALWDFRQPAVSEQRFRVALKRAQGDEAFILQTQIARTFGLRRDFDQARSILRSIEPQLGTVGAEARVRWKLEFGRSWASGTHAKDAVTPEAKATARAAWQEALDTARAAQLDGLAVDAIHMFAFIDTAPADQLKWAQQALAVVQASKQAEGQRWEASVRQNLGYALHQLGRYDEALEQYRLCVPLRERMGNAANTHIAHWLVAWTLRALKRHDEALAIQLRLEREQALGKPDAYVFEELEALYRAQGDTARAEHYAQLRQALPK